MVFCLSERRLADRDFLVFWEEGPLRFSFMEFFSPIGRTETSH